MVYSCMLWRNMFELKGGISKTQSPSKIILNWHINSNTHCQVEFGHYDQTHEEHDNSLAMHTIGTIVARSMGNIQGGYYFIWLDKGRHINRHDWTALPMPNEVIQQVHHLACYAKANKTLWFTNKHNEDLDVLYADLDSDEDDDLIGNYPAATTGVDNEDSNSDDEDYLPGDNDNNSSSTHNDSDSNSNDSDEADNDDDSNDNDNNHNVMGLKPASTLTDSTATSPPLDQNHKMAGVDNGEDDVEDENPKVQELMIQQEPSLTQEWCMRMTEGGWVRIY